MDEDDRAGVARAFVDHLQLAAREGENPAPGHGYFGLLGLLAGDHGVEPEQHHDQQYRPDEDLPASLHREFPRLARCAENQIETLARSTLIAVVTLARHERGKTERAHRRATRRARGFVTEKFVIKGGEPLSGELTAAGNKNAALPILAACLLTEEELLLHRVPRIRDTEAQIALLERLGVESTWVADNSLRLCAKGVSDVSVDEELSKQIRASFLLAGPLLARFGEARMPPPGGDFIGRRRLDAHLDAFKDLGARVDGDRWIELNAPADGLCPCAIFMDEPSVMGTENVLMAAALTKGPTTISNAASEPHVQDLARLLCAMGAQVDGIGSNVMTVHGRDKLAGAEHTISADHIEVGSFMA